MSFAPFIFVLGPLTPPQDRAEMIVHDIDTSEPFLLERIVSRELVLDVVLHEARTSCALDQSVKEKSMCGKREAASACRSERKDQEEI